MSVSCSMCCMYDILYAMLYVMIDAMLCMLVEEHSGTNVLKGGRM